MTTYRRIKFEREPGRYSCADYSIARSGEGWEITRGSESLGAHNRLREAREVVKQLVTADRAGAVAEAAAADGSALSYERLQSLFWRAGIVSGGLLVGAVRVSKDFTTYRSNSGKSSDTSVAYRWTEADGTRREIKRASVYEENRRNDPSRGLGTSRVWK